MMIWAKMIVSYLEIGFGEKKKQAEIWNYLLTTQKNDLVGPRLYFSDQLFSLTS